MAEDILWQLLRGLLLFVVELWLGRFLVIPVRTGVKPV